MLGFSCVLGIVQILLASHSASFQRGYRWTVSSREGLVPPLTGIANCFDRALRNFLETFPIFAAIVLATELTGRQGPITFWGVHLYLGASSLRPPLRCACCSFCVLEHRDVRDPNALSSAARI